MAWPIISFFVTYANPRNMVFDVASGGGVIAFNNVAEGFRCHVQLALWSPRAMRKPQLVRAAAMAAMLAFNLQIIEAFIRADNTLALRIARKCGMKTRFTIPRSGWYNGVAHDMVWLEIDRETLGLPPAE